MPRIPNPIRVGLLGAGFISHYHINGLHEAGARVVAIYSRTLATAQARARQYDIPYATDQLDEFLAQAEIDAVVIVTPDFLHAQHAIQALQAGKPTLLQKPMAHNMQECTAILQAVQQTGTPLYVGFMHRYFEEIALLRELLAAGVLGEIHLIRQRNATAGADWAAWFYRREKVGGGVLLQLGTHGIDLVQYIFGGITQVRATTAQMMTERTLADGSVIRPDNEDLVLAQYRLASGALVTHECSYTEVAGTDRFRMEVYGSQGTAWLRTERGRLALYAPDYLGHTSWFAPDIKTERVGYRQHRHLIDMLRGDAPDDDSAAAGVRSIAVAEAVYRAAAADDWEPV